MHTIARSLLLTAAALPLCAAVAGLPEQPRPGARATAWAQLGNDMLGGEFGQNTDDRRTNAMSLGIEAAGWTVGADHSIATDRFAADPRRSDQLSIAAGRVWNADLGAGGLRLAGGLGLRLTGDLGGGAMQDAWHQRNGFRRYVLREDDSASEGYAWAQASWLLPLGAALGLESRRVSAEFAAEGLASSGDEQSGEVGARLVVLGVDAHAYLGVALRGSAGDAANATWAGVADHEQAAYLTWGLSAGGWFFAGRSEIGGPATWGALGWQWGREPGLRPTRTADLDGAFAVYQGYAVGLQYRWQPDWLAAASDRQLSTFVDYRFGRYPGPSWEGSNSVVLRQGTAGFDWTPATWRWSHGEISPFAQGGAGLREERIRANSEITRFPDQEARRLVAVGAVGLRVLFAPWGAGDAAPAYGFSLTYDAWQPLGDATAENAATGDRASYMQGGAAAGLRFNARVAW